MFGLLFVIYIYMCYIVWSMLGYFCMERYFLRDFLFDFVFLNCYLVLLAFSSLLLAFPLFLLECSLILLSFCLLFIVFASFYLFFHILCLIFHWFGLIFAFPRVCLSSCCSSFFLNFVGVFASFFWHTVQYNLRCPRH